MRGRSPRTCRACLDPFTVLPRRLLNHRRRTRRRRRSRDHCPTHPPCAPCNENLKMVVFENASSPLAANAYEEKTSHEVARLVRSSKRAGLPQSFGDPLSGVVLVAERDTASAEVADAL